MMKYQPILLIVTTIYSSYTLVQAVDRRRINVFNVVSTEPAETKPQYRPDNRLTRTRHVLAAAHTTKGNVENDPFSNNVVLSENEDALVRSLQGSGSLPPSSPGTVVSSHREVIGPSRVESILQCLITVLFAASFFVLTGKSSSVQPRNSRK
jgi:hypothetical protein